MCEQQISERCRSPAPVDPAQYLALHASLSYHSPPRPGARPSLGAGSPPCTTVQVEVEMVHAVLPVCVTPIGALALLPTALVLSLTAPPALSPRLGGPTAGGLGEPKSG